MKEFTYSEKVNRLSQKKIEIFLIKEHKINVNSYTYDSPKNSNENENKNSHERVATFIKNFESAGFTFSKELIEKLFHADLDPLYKDLLPAVRKLIGDHVTHKPMYPNFPRQVMEASESELYLNAMMHYLSFQLHDLTGGQIDTWLPNYVKTPREDLIDNYKLNIIGLGNEKEFRSIFTKLLGSNKSISYNDYEIIDFFFENYNPNILQKYFPDVIPQKEQLTYSICKIYEKGISDEFTINPVKTATDVLRVAVAMSDQDISLSKAPKFKSFKRSERKFLLGMLDSLNDGAIEDMYRFKNMWLRLGEIIHPGDYAKTFPKAYSYFTEVRNNNHVITFNSKLERGLKEKDFDTVIGLLKSRPGEFTRRLNEVLTTFDTNYKQDYTLDAFEKVASDVSTPVLLQLHGFYKTHKTDTEYRLFFPKGKVMKAKAIKNNVSTVPKDLYEEIKHIIANTLRERFSKLEVLGKVYVDPELCRYPVPFEGRSLPEMLKPMSRGSKIPIKEDGNILRLFLHWKNSDQRVDLDLSAVMYNEKWECLTKISYTNLRDKVVNAVHSGDITDAPDGASEFIDINLNLFKTNGGRYVVMNVFSFTRQPYYEIPECFAGWMTRQNSQSGEVFDARTVENKFNLTGESQHDMIMVVDVVDNNITWLDFSINKAAYEDIPNNIENSAFSIRMLCKALLEQKRTSLYELLMLHAQARGEVIYNEDKKEEADVIFDTTELPYKLDYIGNEFMI